MLRRLLAIVSLLLMSVVFCLPGFGYSVPWLLTLLPAAQLVPAILAGSFVWVVVVLLVTWLFGRAYCSVICPLGLLQDVAARLRRLVKRPKPWKFQPARPRLRYALLALFVVCLIVHPLRLLANLLEPYSIFGRMARELLGRFITLLNNGVAKLEGLLDTYICMPQPQAAVVWPALLLATAMLVSLIVLSYRYGRWWCGNVCPVGTALGLVSRHAQLQLVIDHDRCRHCGRCGRVCKANCIDMKAGKVDMSRCVDCFNCLEACNEKAISFKSKEKRIKKKDIANPSVDGGQRAMLGLVGTTAVLSAGSALAARAQSAEKVFDGGYEPLKPREPSQNDTPLRPPGAVNGHLFLLHCTACQLCAISCPSHLIVPDTDLRHFMMPRMDYRFGWCRPECNACGTVCPTGAIRPLSLEQKAVTHIGYATCDVERCLIATDGETCGNCQRHCPTQAISLLPLAEGHPATPVVDRQRCIGCGACENLCPARPLAAIHVLAFERHVVGVRD